MKKYFERMRGHEKFTMSLEISSAAPRINNDCSLIYIILLCLTPDDFIRQGESAATHWVKETIQY
jgi:hypothetical protein